MAACAVGGDQPNAACRAVAAMLIPDTHRPDEAIAKIRRPILLVHGDADTIIPISHSRALAAAANGHAQLIELPGGDHNTLRDSHPEIERLVIEFFGKHLGEAQAGKPVEAPAFD
jgi:pimeloyl-ACP methyl ester carboxylesterase